MIEVPQEGRQTGPTSSADLVGLDGNAFVVIGATAGMLRRAGASKAFVGAFQTEAMSGDYDHVIQTAMAYLDAGDGGIAGPWPEDENEDTGAEA